MNIVIYGTGGVGGYFGARLHQAGNKVTFIARGEHLRAIQQNGLLVKSIKGDYLVKNAVASHSLNNTKAIDLILICVKTWQLSNIAETIKPFLNESTIVISLLNGVDNAAVLSSIINKNNVMGGLCKIVSKVEDYGVINHLSYEPTIVFGELNNTITARALQLKDVFENAGFKTVLSSSIQQEIWTKFLFITTISAIGALTRATIGEMLAQPYIKDLMRLTAQEIVEVAKSKGVYLPDDCIERQFKIIENQPYNTTSSLQRDIIEGKPSELDSQNGTVVRLGAEMGIPTPVNSFIYHCLLPQEKKART